MSRLGPDSMPCACGREDIRHIPEGEVVVPMGRRTFRCHGRARCYTHDTRKKCYRAIVTRGEAASPPPPGGREP